MLGILKSCFFIIYLVHAEAPSAIAVFTEKAQRRPIFNVLTFPARIESRVNAIVRAEAEGAITQILKPLGSRVHRGDIIAIVKHTDPIYEYEPSNVIASVSGVVNEVNVTEGSLVSKSDPIVTLTDPAQLRVIIEVDALDLPSVRTGVTGELSIPGMNKVILARVQGISPSIDPMLGTATCELHVADLAAKQIVSGMVGRVSFKLNPHKGFLLPDNAVVYHGDNTYVRLVVAGKANNIQVKLGERRQGMVEILTGLKEGDEVIDRASRYVSEGAPVQVETATLE